jgi:hypothetical protein
MKTDPKTFFDAVLPAIDLGCMADRTFLMGSTRALFAGGMLLTLGFLWRVIAELWNFVRHRETDFASPFLHLVGFCALFAAYKPFAVGLVQFISNLGLDMGGGSFVHETFARRFQAFHHYATQKRLMTGMRFLTPDGLAISAMVCVTELMYIAVQAAAFVIKTTQLFTLAAIIAFGPILLGFASLSPFFHSLGVGWFWALVEVSAWSFTMDVMLFVFDGMGRNIPKNFLFAQEIVVCSVVLFGMLAITRVTAMLIRGQSAGSIGQAPVMLATGGAMLGLRSSKAWAMPGLKSSKAWAMSSMRAAARRVLPRGRP